MSRASLPSPGAALPHYVNEAPFNPHQAETLTAAQERVYLASQWRLMWWKFLRHRIAVISGCFLIFVYFCVVFAEMISPYNA
ncbi:MAG: ABC transporter permease, partial [Pseudomonadota bacterium]